MTHLMATAVSELLFWGLLIGGLALTVGGSWQSILRYRDWKRAGQFSGSETVRADQTIKVGMAGTVEFAGNATPKSIACSVVGCSRSVVTLLVDGWEAGMPRSIIGAGRVTHVALHSPSGILQFTANIQSSHNDGTGSPSLFVSLPFWITRIQRRAAFRQRLCMPVTILNEPWHTTATSGFCRSGLVDNLSASGCCIELEGTGSPQQAAATLDLLKPDTIILVKLPIPAISRELNARVVISERISVRGGNGVRLRCSFFDMQPYEQELLVSAVFAAQRQSLKLGTA